MKPLYLILFLLSQSSLSLFALGENHLSENNQASLSFLIGAIRGTHLLVTNAWKETSSSAGKTMRQWEQPELVLGVQPQQVLSYWQSNQLERIEIIFLEAGNYFGVRESDELLDEVAGIEDRGARKLQQKKIRGLIEKENEAREGKRAEFSNLFKK
ncbi:MAG: hypothetical protein R3F23_03255 [Verrucomicrobiia bacterium]